MALNFDEFQKVVETAQQADAVKSDLKRTLKKVTSALSALQAALGEMETVLSDEYVSAPKERKTRQPRAPREEGEAGAAPKKPGRPKKNQE
jgi:Skp family chaperone for outer membrane proteins